MSQKAAVLAHLQSGKTITPLKAQAEYRIWRLADVIYKLKHDGHSIRTTIKKSLSGSTYAEYSLETL
jgi:hypothetical protein